MDFVVGVGFGRTTLTILTNLLIFVVGVGFERTTRTTQTDLWIFCGWSGY